MYGGMAALYGCLLSLMNACNAQLSSRYGDYSAAVMIHAVGLIVLLPFAFTAWGRPQAKGKWYQYTGGLIGIVTLVFVNIGVSGLGVTGNLVLMLLGQVTASALVDHFALLGAKRSLFSGRKGIAIAVMALGCALMLILSGERWGTSLVAAVLSFLSGWSMVLSRMANASLAQTSGTGFSTLMNYVTGLTGSLFIFMWLRSPMRSAFPAPGVSFVIYLGGALGALGIFLCNVVTPKLSALQMSLIVFVGQIFSGMALDALSGKFALGTLVGGILVAVGMVLNASADRRA